MDCSELRILCHYGNDVVLQITHISTASCTVLRSTMQWMRSSHVKCGLSVCPDTVPIEPQKALRQLGKK